MWKFSHKIAKSDAARHYGVDLLTLPLSQISCIETPALIAFVLRCHGAQRPKEPPHIYCSTPLPFGMSVFFGYSRGQDEGLDMYSFIHREKQREFVVNGNNSTSLLALIFSKNWGSPAAQQVTVSGSLAWSPTLMLQMKRVCASSLALTPFLQAHKKETTDALAMSLTMTVSLFTGLQLLLLNQTFRA